MFSRFEKNVKSRHFKPVVKFKKRKYQDKYKIEKDQEFGEFVDRRERKLDRET